MSAAAANWARVAAAATDGARGLALGTVQWGQVYGIANRTGQPARPAVGELLTAARRARIFVLDTARAYGSSEAVIGSLAGADPHWCIITKLDPAARTIDAAAQSLDASRQALGRPELDCVLLHRAEQRTVERGELWQFLRSERDQGGIGAVGMSAASPDEAWDAVADPDVACVQVASSLFDQRLARGDFFERARDAGKVVFVRSVFLQGAAHLDAGELPPHLAPLREPLGVIDDWARQRGVPRSQAFLAYAAGLPGAWVLIGCETVAQLEQNLQDWSAARRLKDSITSLADALPELPAAVLNPALWPARETHDK